MNTNTSDGATSTSIATTATTTTVLQLEQQLEEPSSHARPQRLSFSFGKRGSGYTQGQGVSPMPTPMHLAMMRFTSPIDSRVSMIPTPKTAPAPAPASTTGTDKSKTMSTTTTTTMTSPNNSSQRKSRSPWTDEEDATLIAVMDDISQQNIDGGGGGGGAIINNNIKWRTVAEMMSSGRTGKQCRDRYLNHLRGGITKGPWTVEEEKLVKDMHDTFGPRWAAMSKILKVRSDNDIKNKWYSMVRKKKRMNQKLVVELQCNTNYFNNAGTKGATDATVPPYPQCTTTGQVVASVSQGGDDVANYPHPVYSSTAATHNPSPPGAEPSSSSEQVHAHRNEELVCSNIATV